MEDEAGDEDFSEDDGHARVQLKQLRAKREASVSKGDASTGQHLLMPVLSLPEQLAGGQVQPANIGPAAIKKRSSRTTASSAFRQLPPR